MYDLDASTSLADIATNVPGSERVLESYGLDYCCGGGTSLADACSGAGLDVSVMLERLSAIEPKAQPAWQTMGPSALVDHIESTHHAYLHAELPRLVELAAKVASVHGDRHPELIDVQRAVEELRADLDPHLMKEEQVLFPMIRELASADRSPQFHCGSLQNPISVMLREHDDTGELLARLRRLTSGYETPDDACGSYQALYAGLAEVEADTHRHVHVENNLLFPTVVDLERSLASATA